MPKILLSGCLFTVLAFSFHLQVYASECVTTVLATRNNLYIPEGGSVSLWCDVHHCKHKWTGGWGIRQRHFTFLNMSERVQLSWNKISDNITRLFLIIHNVNQSDSGAYQCNINWETISSLGHVIKINVTAVPGSTGRKLSYRLLVCAAASLCFPLTLALACCLSSNSQPPPPVPPPRSRNSSTARVKPNADVVYAALTMNHPRQQSAAQAMEATTSVIYSTVTFSTA
ncbi:hypothetical protein KOW79_014478 [Hemibagrus wyckioides]|uniref:Ig-like domain-containing protein n=1 Tax=Hemibagrus wyckioides TaxID=337641 RepID=A0A9D3SFA4_9TELE|nr:uncharacterized protein si:dkey-52l18.4 isoform X2 [Hemibagrus wyckioides]KAG7321620.1 hypothetical protein KOW79_014478 [Hemibagrus wyckioides]